jgi:hypothetical protein
VLIRRERSRACRRPVRRPSLASKHPTHRGDAERTASDATPGESLGESVDVIIVTARIGIVPAFAATGAGNHDRGEGGRRAKQASPCPMTGALNYSIISRTSVFAVLFGPARLLKKV